METWKDIKGYEGIYQVSDEGRVRSLDREVGSHHNSAKKIKGKIKKTTVNNRGYLQVSLSKDGKISTKKIHRLVWLAFNGEIPQGLQVNHIDEDKTNNRLDNLNLMTPKENSNWGTRTERISAKTRGVYNNPKVSHPVFGYDKDCNLVVSFPSIKEASRNGFNHGTVSACANGYKGYKTHKGLKWSYNKL